MGREIKIGLAFLGILGIVFGALLFRRLTASDTDSSSPANEVTASIPPAAADHPPGRGIGIGLNNHRPEAGEAASPKELPKHHAQPPARLAAAIEPTPVESSAGPNPFQRGAPLGDINESPTEAAPPRRLRDLQGEPVRLDGQDEQPQPARPRNPLRRVSAEEPLAEVPTSVDPVPEDNSIPDAGNLSNAPVQFGTPTEPGSPDEPQPRALDAGPTEAVEVSPRMVEAREEEEAPAETPREPEPRQPIVQAQVPRDRYADSRPVAAAVEPVVTENGKYTVQPGDSLSSISEKVYGNSRYFKALYEHNRTKLPHADRLTVGTVIATPPVSLLEQNYPTLCPKQRHSALVKSRTLPAAVQASTRPASRGDNVYVVEEGDTLFDIARHELGKASRWAEIYSLNRETLGNDFDYLQPGTELVMPAKASGGDSMTRQADDRYQR